MMSIVVVLLVFVAPVHGTGAYCSVWHVDLDGAPDDYDGRVFLQKHVENYGVNRYVAIFSHPSQWWYEVYAVFFEEDLADISDAYVLSRSGKRHYVFIEYVQLRGRPPIWRGEMCTKIVTSNSVFL